MLLMQHSLAVAAMIFWQCSGFHRTSHSIGKLAGPFKPTFRCVLAELAGRGTKPTFEFRPSLTQHCFALAASALLECGSGSRQRAFDAAAPRSALGIGLVLKLKKS